MVWCARPAARLGPAIRAQAWPGCARWQELPGPLAADRGPDPPRPTLQNPAPASSAPSRRRGNIIRPAPPLCTRRQAVTHQAQVQPPHTTPVAPPCARDDLVPALAWPPRAAPRSAQQAGELAVRRQHSTPRRALDLPRELVLSRGSHARQCDPGKGADDVSGAGAGGRKRRCAAPLIAAPSLCRKPGPGSCHASSRQVMQHKQPSVRKQLARQSVRQAKRPAGQRRRASLHVDGAAPPDRSAPHRTRPHRATYHTARSRAAVMRGARRPEREHHLCDEQGARAPGWPRACAHVLRAACLAGPEGAAKRWRAHRQRRAWCAPKVTERRAPGPRRTAASRTVSWCPQPMPGPPSVSCPQPPRAPAPQPAPCARARPRPGLGTSDARELGGGGARRRECKSAAVPVGRRLPAAGCRLLRRARDPPPSRSRREYMLMLGASRLKIRLGDSLIAPPARARQAQRGRPRQGLGDSQHCRAGTLGTLPHDSGSAPGTAARAGACTGGTPVCGGQNTAVAAVARAAVCAHSP